MKKIIISNYNLNIGGVQKTLLNILNNIDLSKYDITILLYEKENKLIKELPKQIKVLYLSDYVDLENSNSFFARLDKNIKIKKYIKKYNNIIKEEYDIAIAFDGYDNDIDLVIPCIKAKKKIIWVHNDFYNAMKYSKFPFIYYIMYRMMGKKFSLFDEIAIVCNKVADSFNILYKNKYLKKIKIINNYIDTEDIFIKAKEKTNLKLDGEYNIVSTGRICKAKNFELLLAIHKKLIDQGFKVKTYIIGGGNEETKLKCKIDKMHLENSFILLGKQTNPYVIMKQADLFISSSLYESYANTIIESLVLGVPVISTSTSGAQNIAKNIAIQGTCIICNDKNEIYEKTVMQISNPNRIKPLNLEEYNKKVMKSINQLLT